MPKKISSTAAKPVRDIFISYSSLDALFVDKLAKQLKSMGVTLWLDRYEIKPGDYLRERINEGIENAEYFTAVLSPSSIGSEWVKHEVDSAMMRELNEKRVRLIPLLYGSVTAKDLPGDIRGKNYLDFRTDEKATLELKRLIDLLKPEEKLRKEFLKELQAGLPTRDNSVSKLSEVTCTYGDQTIQKAPRGYGCELFERARERTERAVSAQDERDRTSLGNTAGATTAWNLRIDRSKADFFGRCAVLPHLSDAPDTWSQIDHSFIRESRSPCAAHFPVNWNFHSRRLSLSGH
jgi:TIR domain